MIRQLKRFNVSRLRLAGGMDFAVAGFAPRPVSNRSVFAAPSSVYKFPPRPDATIVSETIPLFYIGRNSNGVWVVREADGRSGGLFMLKQSALRFARRQSEPAGCAMMFLAEPFELDIENQGGRYADPVSVIENAARHAPLVGTLVLTAAAAWRKLFAHVSRALAGERKHRAAIEKELFRDQYTLASKNDDDLPVAI
jgi:hypothetical protein